MPRNIPQSLGKQCDAILTLIDEGLTPELPEPSSIYDHYGWDQADYDMGGWCDAS